MVDGAGSRGWRGGCNSRKRPRREGHCSRRRRRGRRISFLRQRPDLTSFIPPANSEPGMENRRRRKKGTGKRSSVRCRSSLRGRSQTAKAAPIGSISAERDQRRGLRRHEDIAFSKRSCLLQRPHCLRG